VSGQSPGHRLAKRIVVKLTPILFATLVSTAACGAETPTEQAVPEPVVHAMLGAGATSHTVVVEDARSVEDGFFRGVTPASGARVVVRTGADAYEFQEDASAPGYYHASFPVEAGRRYSLEVTSRGGRVVTGETLVPAPPRMVRPAADTTVAQGEMARLEWQGSRPSAGYVLVWRRADRDGPSTAQEVASRRAPTVLQDTTVQVDVLSMGVFYGFATELRFFVTAVDENFREYVRPDGEPDPDGARRQIRSTVRGGYGLFGSYAISDGRVVGVR